MKTKRRFSPSRARCDRDMRPIKAWHPCETDGGWDHCENDVSPRWAIRDQCATAVTPRNKNKNKLENAEPNETKPTCLACVWQWLAQNG